MTIRTMQLVQAVDGQPLAHSLEHDRYLQPKQAQRRPPTTYESLLGDSIERAYAEGIHDLPALVASLNRQGTTTPMGAPWTEENYGPLMAGLSR